MDRPAVSTGPAYIFFATATFCAEKHRRNNTSIPIMQATQTALRDYNLGLPKPEAIGIIVEIESTYINQRYPEAFWDATKFGFIGYSPRGLPVRVHYFTDFKLQPPVRIERTQGASDSVANFHLTNGARIEQIHWMGDHSQQGMKRSLGLMVNYFYKLSDNRDT